MNSFKSKRTEPFVTVRRSFIDDETISWRAKGILIYLLSKPPNWQVYEQDIIRHSKEGRDAVRVAIKELMTAGYMLKVRQRISKGTFGGNEYQFSDDIADVQPSTVNQSLVTRLLSNNKSNMHDVTLVSAGKIGKQEKMIPHNAEQYNKLQDVILNRVNYPDGFPPEKRGSTKDWKMG